MRRGQDRVVTSGRLDRKPRADRVDRLGQERFPISAGQPTGAAAVAVALEDGAPYRLARAGAGDPARGEQSDQGKALELGLRVGEGDEASLAERVAAVTGDEVQEVMHFAVALAEQGYVVGRRRTLDPRYRDQPLGRKAFAGHEVV